ncbi:HIT family protein [Candidatus Woesearchaeota archaeon]|nr:HIT family protein [Candidatus Woesearchaeota archaeon]
MPQQQMSEEQVNALQEKIKNMSPEELKEFQKKQCIFCQIVSGKVQSRKVYEDDKTIAVLDINPANPGHILLLPKEHYSIMPQMSEDEISHMFMVTKSLSNVLLRGIGAQGTNIIATNGVAAGQRAQHFMIHIIPRMDKDNLDFTLPQHTISEKELDEVSKKLSKSLGGIKESASEAPPKFTLPEKKVVDAEFKEKPTEKQSESKGKKPEKKKLKSAEKTKKKAEKKENRESVDLDDIARILGAK